MAIWVAETRNKITFVKQSAFVGLLPYFMDLINARNVEHIRLTSIMQNFLFKYQYVRKYVCFSAHHESIFYSSTHASTQIHTEQNGRLQILFLLTSVKKYMLLNRLFCGLRKGSGRLERGISIADAWNRPRYIAYTAGSPVTILKSLSRILAMYKI